MEDEMEEPMPPKESINIGMVKLDDTSKLKDAVDPPSAGMIFKSIDELYEYYKTFGNQEGFPVFKKSTKNDKQGRLHFVTLSCGRGGKSRCKREKLVNPILTMKIECNAKLNARVYDDGVARVTSVFLDHNHELSPTRVRYLPRRRSVTTSIKRRREKVDEVGVDVAKPLASSSSIEYGGQEDEPSLEKMCQNYISNIDKVRKLCLDVGDAGAVCNYFNRMQEQNSNFYHSVDFNEEGRIRNLFWADERSRVAYQSFNDVVTFDTTHLTNKYDIPLVTFVGMNHHGQPILFGCGLVSGEDAETFVWLFMQLLACMCGNAPSAIITDQDIAIQKAVEIVFPETRHGWCLGHIIKKIPGKLSCHSNYEPLNANLMQVVYDSMRKEQFDFSWGQMIQKYGLESNPWLSTLFDNRHQWVPVYVKDSFWAGMSAVQRNESVHAFFEGHTNSKTTLKQFLDRYDKALRVRVEKELHEDLNSFNYCCPCVSHYNIEKQYQQAYTDSKFKETQEEFKGKMFCYVHSVKEEDVFGVYEVIEDMVVENGLSNQKVVFTVYFKQPEFDVRCSCRLFEFRGILCRHIITLLTVKGVYSVPYKYILPRWRKDLRREHTKVKVSYNNWNTTPQMQRYDLISKKSLMFADFGSTSEENTQIALDFIEQFRQKFNIADPMAVTAQPFQ
ncbi:protein FAR-RED IMPAIRED RESPONSE 1-like [Zingiber officinale]|uniref:protein FAR-RED IMPAIRED RESPONSE 1-like n=1 Tax=Zingiber officinale TaxID=94328 RepID=UPI001C4D5F25|nr:protein FAR-RED IMPAIRED RESPONSE 1-like [Zingiber officinale]XP_042429912.1 protein FAR-RED IMPAIRED RESPONSE 1-like [Zingiber officinale]